MGLGILFAVLLAEAGVRLFVPRKLWEFWDATADWVPDSKLGWINQPNRNVTRHAPHEGYLVAFQTNADGISPGTAQRAKKPGVIRILMLGDSGVVGLSVPADKRINAALERLLESRGWNVEVLNAGVQGYSTDQELLLAKRLAPLYHPEIITLCAVDNDFSGNVERSVLGGYPKPMFVLKANGQLDEIPPEMSRFKKHDLTSGPLRWVIGHSALYGLIQPSFFRLRARFMGWNERNMLGLTAEMYTDPGALARFNWALFAAEVKQIDDIARENGAKLICYAHPAVETVWNPAVERVERQFGVKPEEYDRYALERQIGKTCQNEGIPFCPLIDYFLANESRGPFHLLPRDPHCNATGYELQAEALAKFFADAKLLPPPASGEPSGRSPAAR